MEEGSNMERNKIHVARFMWRFHPARDNPAVGDILPLPHAYPRALLGIIKREPRITRRGAHANEDSAEASARVYY